MNKNPYFNNGFDDVYQDEVTGIVHNAEPVFPADNLGNYFYLRLPNNIRFNSYNYFLQDELANKPAKVYDVVLVACVSDANAETLLDNLIVTLSDFAENIVPQSATVQGNVVINQELGYMSKENREAALQRKPANMTIVSLAFNYTTETLKNCIEDLCN